MHQNPEVVAEFLELETESGRNLRLVGNHLIPLLDCGKSEIPDPDVLLGGSKFASRAEVGECLQGPEGLERITKIRKLQSAGIYAPVTESGGILVDGLTASCFSFVESHNLQKMIFGIVNKILDFYQFFFVGNSLQLDPPGFVQFLIETVSSTSVVSA